MADKSVNVKSRTNLVAAQSPARPQISVSFESTTVDVASGGALNVEGIANIFVYGAADVTCSDDGTTFVAMENPDGTPVAIATARLLDVRGVRWVSFNAAVSVVFTG